MSSILVSKQLQIPITITSPNVKNLFIGQKIASTLGCTLDDETASAVGNLVQTSIADESGNILIPVSELVAAGKDIFNRGGFPSEIIRKYGDIRCILMSELPLMPNNSTWYGPVGTILPSGSSSSEYPYLYYKKKSSTSSGELSDTKIAGIKYNDEYYLLCTSKNSNISGGYFSENYENSGAGVSFAKHKQMSSIINVPITTVNSKLSSSYGLESYGEYSEESKPSTPIVWTASDSEISEQLVQEYTTYTLIDSTFIKIGANS